jgi:methyl-accepting chemotaxis protein
MTTMLFMAFRLGMAISRPLKQFNEVMLAVASGDLTRQAVVAGGNELSSTAVALNQATGRMRDVAQVSAQLREAVAELRYQALVSAVAV